MELLTGVLGAFGLSASAGLNAYIPLLVIALVARFTDFIKLSSPWDTLTSGWIIGLLILLSLIEFFADKVPAINHVNDLLQTIVRPVAGAIVFAASANVTAAVVFALSGAVVWLAALAIAMGSIPGGYVGGRVARRLPGVVLRGLVVLIGVGATLYLLLGR